jgi:hypothetical protein
VLWRLACLRGHESPESACPPVLGVAGAGQDVQHAVQIVHRALDRGADVNVDDGGAGHVGGQLLAQLVVVNLAALQSAHLAGDGEGGL